MINAIYVSLDHYHKLSIFQHCFVAGPDWSITAGQEEGITQVFYFNNSIYLFLYSHLIHFSVKQIYKYMLIYAHRWLEDLWTDGGELLGIFLSTLHFDQPLHMDGRRYDLTT